MRLEFWAHFQTIPPLSPPTPRCKSSAGFGLMWRARTGEPKCCFLLHSQREGRQIYSPRLHKRGNVKSIKIAKHLPRVVTADLKKDQKPLKTILCLARSFMRVDECKWWTVWMIKQGNTEECQFLNFIRPFFWHLVPHLSPRTQAYFGCSMLQNMGQWSQTDMKKDTPRL